ncbi:hypothetical protein Pmar_PMAR016432 [Perkinsus marinus ATCC 50983]|uniref:Uncharacterized protein n=1 Tax=Perkinsus marinus (strain ATCC 50983 / TXsc) TaxID=423536 RepID=C5L194_PERM5|nr:hypothetical protein Pmar_PMAR016432 [Perkinsus marinus ATCC 50983]EER09501.1 hypothetical protein Pmar_PMAR016432 [Perkinsus marinus ATCC 50983]|eukprot:XP_002777685.1 hypothetical protein Pmar_PMAR016432 [Perkinsus marinus ATCC 50983]
MDVFDGHSLMTKTILYDDAKYGLQGPGLAKIAAYAANNAAFKSQLEAETAVKSAQRALHMLNQLSQAAPIQFDAARTR